MNERRYDFRALCRRTGTSKRRWVGQGRVPGTQHQGKGPGQVEEAAFSDQVKAQPRARDTATEPRPEREKKYLDLFLLLSTPLLLCFQEPSPSRSLNELSAAVFRIRPLSPAQGTTQIRERKETDSGVYRCVTNGDTEREITCYREPREPESQSSKHEESISCD